MRVAGPLAAAWILALLAAGCDAPPPISVQEPVVIRATPAEHGQALFGSRPGGLCCADCHSTSAEDQPDPARRRVGHTLADGTRRPSWWYGELAAAKGASVGDAVLSCVARFQHRSWSRVLPLLPDGSRDLSKVEVPAADREALVAYLETVARPGPHPAIPSAPDGSREAIARVEALPGDAERGKRVWAAACALCHGNGSPGNLGPTLRGDLAPDRYRVLSYVRRGPNASERKTGDAWMPFFTPDSLPDQDLADVAELIDGAKW